MNEVHLAGYLGEQPELRYTDGGSAVANARMATDESYTGQDGERVDQTEWHDLVFWGRKGEVVNEYADKGTYLVITRGKLQTREWEDQDGNTRRSTEVKVLEFEFGPNTNRDEDTSSGSAQSRQSGGQQKAATTAGGEDEETFEPDDDLPF